MSPAAVESHAAVPPDDPAPAATARYAKTAAGHAEVRGRAQALSRPARNLLLIIDATRPAQDWLTMVQGCGAAELQALLATGLIAPVAAGPAIAPAAPAAAAVASLAAGGPAAPARVPLAQAIGRLGYRTLYERITAEARPQLGLIKGYRLILDMERCNGPDEARALALQFVEQVREAEGPAAAQALAGRLAAPEAPAPSATAPSPTAPPAPPATPGAG